MRRHLEGLIQSFVPQSARPNTDNGMQKLLIDKRRSFHGVFIKHHSLSLCESQFDLGL